VVPGAVSYIVAAESLRLMVGTDVGRICGRDGIAAIGFDTSSSLALHRDGEEVLRMADLCRG
jgi:hypothetical protein